MIMMGSMVGLFMKVRLLIVNLSIFIFVIVFFFMVRSFMMLFLMMVILVIMFFMVWILIIKVFRVIIHIQGLFIVTIIMIWGFVIGINGMWIIIVRNFMIWILMVRVFMIVLIMEVIPVLMLFVVFAMLMFLFVMVSSVTVEDLLYSRQILFIDQPSDGSWVFTRINSCCLPKSCNFLEAVESVQCERYPSLGPDKVSDGCPRVVDAVQDWDPPSSHSAQARARLRVGVNNVNGWLVDAHTRSLNVQGWLGDHRSWPGHHSGGGLDGDHRRHSLSSSSGVEYGWFEVQSRSPGLGEGHKWIFVPRIMNHDLRLSFLSIKALSEF